MSPPRIDLGADEPFIDPPRQAGVVLGDVACVVSVGHALSHNDPVQLVTLLLAAVAMGLVETQPPAHALRLAGEAGPELARLVQEFSELKLRHTAPGGQA